MLPRPPGVASATPTPAAMLFTSDIAAIPLDLATPFLDTAARGSSTGTTTPTGVICHTRGQIPIGANVPSGAKLLTGSKVDNEATTPIGVIPPANDTHNKPEARNSELEPQVSNITTTVPSKALIAADAIDVYGSSTDDLPLPPQGTPYEDDVRHVTQFLKKPNKQIRRLIGYRSGSKLHGNSSLILDHENGKCLLVISLID